MDIFFFLNAAGLGLGLAMDAFSVSMANGLSEPAMKTRKAAGIALVFALFQTAMPLIGWYCVHSIAEAFAAFRPAIPWIALVLLLFIGGKMLLEGIRNKGETEKTAAAAAEVAARYRENPRQKLLLFVGRLYLLKNLELAIDACARLRAPLRRRARGRKLCVRPRFRVAARRTFSLLGVVAPDAQGVIR